jgi:hypothetical protein
MKEIQVLSFITSIIFAIPTLIISVIVAYIAIRQYQTNKKQQLINEERFKLDLFDKRFKVYEATRILFFNIMQSGAEIDNQVRRDFGFKTLDAVFLFDETTSKYLEEVHKKASRLVSISIRYKTLPVGEKRDKLVDEQMKIDDWFNGEYFKLQDTFSRYLKFKELKS